MAFWRTALAMMLLASVTATGCQTEAMQVESKKAALLEAASPPPDPYCAPGGSCRIGLYTSSYIDAPAKR